MDYNIIELNIEQRETLDDLLDEYDFKHIQYKLNGNISLGIEINNELIAGIDATVSYYKILYINTLFVKEPYRRKGIGSMLLKKVESKAKELGLNTIRLDTFDWQGKDFYLSEGYQIVGNYKIITDNFEEYFFIKELL